MHTNAKQMWRTRKSHDFAALPPKKTQKNFATPQISNTKQLPRSPVLCTPPHTMFALARTYFISIGLSRIL